MERVIICSGDYVSLAVLVREDAPVLYRIINDPEVHRFLSSPSRIYSLVDEYEWIDNSANVYEKSVNFAIIENKTKEVAGIIGINPIDSDRNGHVGYFLSRDKWGMGYMTESLKLMVEFSFNTMNLRKLYTNVYKPNKASKKVLEKNGFKHSGTMKDHHFVPGYGYVDEFYYELINKNYK